MMSLTNFDLTPDPYRYNVVKRRRIDFERLTNSLKHKDPKAPKKNSRCQITRVKHKIKGTRPDQASQRCLTSTAMNLPNSKSEDQSHRMAFTSDSSPKLRGYQGYPHVRSSCYYAGSWWTLKGSVICYDDSQNSKKVFYVK